MVDVVAVAEVPAGGDASVRAVNKNLILEKKPNRLESVNNETRDWLHSCSLQERESVEIVISLPLFLRERRVNFCESLETVYRVKFNATQLL